MKTRGGITLVARKSTQHMSTIYESVQCGRRMPPLYASTVLLPGSKLLDHSQSPGPTCESCMWRGSVGPARGWSTQPLGPGYVAELRRAARRDARVPAATRRCPPRREGARLLLVGPLGLLLLDECLHADLLVLGREGRIEEHPLEPQALRQRGFEGGVDERLRKRGNRLRV